MKKLKFLKFALVGAVGFGVDIGSTYIVVNFAAISPLWARLPAWLLAVTTTYVLNIIFTFSKSTKALTSFGVFIRGYMPYIVSQFGGGVVNICTYSALLMFMNAPIYLAVVAGTFLGLIFNFVGASLVLEGSMAPCKYLK